MATLERLDAIRDQLINQGIGTSGLTSQAIQRANLPDLRSSIATGEATRANEQQSRMARLLNQTKRGLKSGSRVGSIVGNTPGVISIADLTSTQSGFILPGANGNQSSSSYRFSLSVPSVGGGPKTVGFGSIPEMKDYAKKYGINLFIAPGQNTSEFQGEFDRAGISRMSVEDAEGQIQRIGRRGVMGQLQAQGIGFGRKSKKVSQTNQKETGRRSFSDRVNAIQEELANNNVVMSKTDIENRLAQLQAQGLI